MRTAEKKHIGEEPELTMCQTHWERDVKSVPAEFIAPRHVGGDVDRPAHWVPVCRECAEKWWTETELHDRLPMFGIDSGFYLFIRSAPHVE